jgi:adenosylcobyric acid synthase
VVLEEEDSLAGQLEERQVSLGVDIAVIRFPKISNFTDFQVLTMEPGVSVRYVCRPQELGKPDVIILPGTKNTIADLRWLRESGLEAAVLRASGGESLIIGICGGYQMLGQSITDTSGTEGGGSVRGMGLLPVETCFEPEKTRCQIQGATLQLPGVWQELSEKKINGYEIHMGRSQVSQEGNHFLQWADASGERVSGCCRGQVLGTYLHGMFDEEEFRTAFIKMLYRRKGMESREPSQLTYGQYKEMQYDKLADMLRNSLDLQQIYDAIFE